MTLIDSITLVMNPGDETKLIRAAAAGDAAAFSNLYRLHRDRVYGFAYRMLGAQSVAEDVTHEAFLVLIEHPERYRPERGSLLTFLCAVTRNHIMHHFRRRGYELSETDCGAADLTERANETERDPLGNLLEQELAARVNNAIAALPPLQREAIVLREFQELSYEEIAVVTGAGVNVVRGRLHRARQSLAEQLAPYMNEDSKRYELRRG
ncbi:MAG TPA: RNA polymerase sigma factor [Pyrinomonadaceae bacterium]|nr:RNA polymerase sigma factor [Pyrinomonadaceae bacterium]